MSSLLSVPFNFSPTGYINQSTTYTVPVGTYALVNLFFTKSEPSTTLANITLNGTTILTNRCYFLYDLTFTIPNFTCVVYGFTGTGVGESGYPWSGSNSNNYSGIASATSSSSGQGVLNVQMPTKLTIFVKSGDVIDGSGSWKIVGNTFASTLGTSGYRPFNYEPSQTVVATSSYTIPAGKYAIVNHYFLYQSYISTACPNYPSVNTLTVNGAVVKYISNRVPFPYFEYYDAKSSTSITYDFRQKNYFTVDEKALTYEAKAGDVISGSGTWRAIISLYDIPA